MTTYLSLLFERAADQNFVGRQYDTAIAFNFLAKTPQLERLSNFASMGHLEQVIDYIDRLFLTKCADIARTDRMHLATLLINCLVNLYADKQMKDEPGGANVLKRLAAFLKDNTYYDEHLVIRVLVNYSLYEHAEGCAHHRMNFACLIDNMSRKFTTQCELFENGDITSCAKRFAAERDFIRVFTSSAAIRAFLVKPTLLNLYLRILTNCLPYCNEQTLIRVAELFNPHAAYGQLLLNRVLPRQHSQFPNCDINDPELIARRDLLSFYIFVLLLIYRFKNKRNIFADQLISSIEPLNDAGKSAQKLKSVHRPVISSGGQFHAAMIVDGRKLIYVTNQSKIN